MVDYQAMGRRIKIKRHEKMMSQQQVADKINISLSHYGNIERGNRIPSVDTLVAIANVLGVGMDYLLAESVDVAFPLRTPEERRTVRNYLRTVIDELDYSITEDTAYPADEKVKRIKYPEDENE